MKSIDEQIKEKQDMLTATWASLDLMLPTATPAQKSKMRELQDRLEFRLLQHELSLLTDKVDIYSQALAILSKK